MTWRLIDWIWHVRGRIALPAGQSIDDAFDRLGPLFDVYGTSHERTGNTLRFRKQDPAAQDKMSVFDSGILVIDGADPVLHYTCRSRMLLFCFVLPLLFVGIARLTVEVGKYRTPPAEKAEKAEKPEKAEIAQHPLDKALGAPAPEKKGKDKAAKEKAKKEKAKKEAEKFSPMPALVFAGIFAALYIVGRILEDQLVNRLFRKRLFDAKG